jgi:hypothetical protein
LVIRRRSFSLLFRYSCLHSHSRGVHGWIPPPLHPPHDAPLPIHTPGRPRKGTDGATCECHGFGGVLEPRYIVGAESLDQ